MKHVLYLGSQVLVLVFVEDHRFKIIECYRRFRKRAELHQKR